MSMEGKKDPLAETVIDPGALVDYGEGSVVSRAIVTKKAGTITVFAFDAGEGLSEHTAPYDAIVQVLEGEAEITVGGRPYTLTAGEMIIMPARVPHALSARQRFKMLLVMIHE